MKTTILEACVLATCLVAGLYRAISPPETKAGNSWDQKAAAAYLEQRAGWWITWPVASRAVCAAGMKYAKPPATDDSAMTRTTRTMVRNGLSRRRDALARCPGLEPKGTGLDSNLWAGIPL